MIMFLLKFILPFIVLVFLKRFIDKKFENINNKLHVVFSALIVFLLLVIGAISVISLIIFFVPNLGIDVNGLDKISNLIAVNFMSFIVWIFSKPLLIMEIFFVLLVSVVMLYIKKIDKIEITRFQINTIKSIVFIAGCFITAVVPFVFYRNDKTFDAFLNDFLGTVFVMSIYIFAIINSFLLLRVIDKLFGLGKKHAEENQKFLY